jgi:phosphoribosylaminoimidazole-succinocarboxamide synthase
MAGNVITRTDFKDIGAVRRGKVRDVYDMGDRLLIVASDRISAFDVVMDDPVPDKGRILTTISLFWFERLKDIVENHIISTDPDEYPEPLRKYKNDLAGRSMLVKKAKPLPVECIVRGYISGSGWNDYQKSGAVCGIPLPRGLKESEILPEPIFTPSTKAEQGSMTRISPLKRPSVYLGKIPQKRSGITASQSMKAAENTQGKRG